MSKEARYRTTGIIGQMLEFLLYACQGGGLLDTQPQVRLETFAMRDTEMAPRVDVARQG